MRSSFLENQRRSILKSISFRILIVVSDGIIVFAITHRYDVTFGVMLWTNVASTVLYYAHERVWNTIHYGKVHRKRKK